MDPQGPPREKPPDTLRKRLLESARLAPRLLGESTGLVRQFLLRQQNADGGFKDRLGKSDLYYSAFGGNAILALQESAETSEPVRPALQSLHNYLLPFKDGSGLDLVHLCCLARSWAAVREGLGIGPDENTCQRLVVRLESYRSADGGYHHLPGTELGAPYACFLALGAYQDLEAELPGPNRLADCLLGQQQADGSWSNAPQVRASAGSTTVTAGAVTVLARLSARINPRAADWLQARAQAQGGFLAAPNVPMPDLLSTATALHALVALGVSLAPYRQSCLEFIDSLWTNEGGFHGHWLDESVDCEYTFYGLLALGQLALEQARQRPA